MKKFIQICVAVLFIIITISYLYFSSNMYVPINQSDISVVTKVENKTMFVQNDGGYEPIEFKGVNMGAGVPGHFATDFAISEKEYLRWFKQIKEMGANCIRVYTILGDNFYNAFYKYNKDNPDPLYLFHGVWLNDYTLFSHVDAFDKNFLGQLKKDAKDLVDVLHGNKLFYASVQSGVASGNYTKNISEWVVGYILGVEWEDTTVAFTDHQRPEKNYFEGEYLKTTSNASPFEAMLAEFGNEIIEYETLRYGQQKMVAFSNWPTTDPFDYSHLVVKEFLKMAKIDVEHIVKQEKYQSGMFASYHVYPYYPDYLNYEESSTMFVDKEGRVNTYYSYLKKCVDHHTLPVIISEFGVPSSRGMAQVDKNTGRNQGFMSENEQAEALVSMYEDIKSAGAAGSFIFTWQDEWFKRTWNTMGYTDLTNTAYWSDYQTNEQYFGILSFDPGKEVTSSYPDGNLNEWLEEDRVYDADDIKISTKQDERYLYFLIESDSINEQSKIFMPLDITPKSGSSSYPKEGLQFSKPVDFLLIIDGNESRILVQERYEALRALFNLEKNGVDAYEFVPEKDTTAFKTIELPLKNIEVVKGVDKRLTTYETGILTKGNANPESPNYNSLSDYYFSEEAVEIRIPWGILNFSFPAQGKIHDDYYKHYGIETIKIDEFYVGAAIDKKSIELEKVKLKHWGTNINFHERLKPAYYAMQKVWR